jgi:hypothetical protein
MMEKRCAARSTPPIGCSAPTARERARLVAQWYFEPRLPHSGLVDKIADAIREAEAAAYERAAQVADAEVAMNQRAQAQATAAGRENVASHRESDATTAERIAAAIRRLAAAR